MNAYEGPLIATQRAAVFGTHTYVELRQERSRYGITYLVEHGDNTWGHRGTWGRNNHAEAVETAHSAYSWQRDNAKPGQRGA